MTDESMAKERSSFSVVGVGVAAGGRSALEQFFSKLPRESGMAFVVLQREDDTAFLQKVTALPVLHVTQTAALEPDHIYVIPTRKDITVVEGELRLAEVQNQRESLDNFFKCLAEGLESRLVAVLLSDEGDDGLLGLRHVKEHWGITLTPNTELVGANMVDIILPLAELPQKLLVLGQSSGRLESFRQEITTLESQEPVAQIKLPPFDVASEGLKDILSLLKDQTGHDFQNYKHPTLLRRIARRLQVNDLSDMAGYLGLLQKKPEEVQGLLNDLLISVTNFFRDEEAFEALARDVLPRLFANKTATDTVRVWCCGCATGEEAYSLAMLFSEYTSRRADAPKFQIFASDISEGVIRVAREGHYDFKSVAEVSPQRLERFFIKDAKGYRVKKELRDTVLFTLHNVLRDPPFSRLEFISCRNLLIYLNRETQEKVLKLFQFALRPGGYLFLGSSESTESAPGLFMTLDKQNRLYQSRATSASHGALSVLPLSGRWEVKTPDLPLPAREQRVSYGELHYKLLETFAPPSVLVNEDDTIVHISEHAGRFLRMGGGEPSRQLLQSVQPGLKLELQRALFEAKKGVGMGISRDVPFKLEGKDTLVTIRVRLANPLEPGSGFYLVSFEQSEVTVSQAVAEPSVAEPGRDTLVEWLEEELQTSREQLRMTIEQYETSAEELRGSNEELQALNEELRAASEELETSKEELQSANEELLTMVDDLRRTELALRESEAKYRSLFDSIDEGFCIVEMMFDGSGEPKDYLFLETNKVFEEQTGLKQPGGKTALQLVPDLEQWWIDTYGRVAKTGESVRFENAAVPMSRWFDVYASRIGDAASRRVAIVFRDITKRKYRELNLTFLAGLEKDVSLLSSENEMIEMTGERIARHFNLAHCLFVEIDEAAALATVFHDQHAPDAPDLAGIYQLGEFHTEAERQRLAGGEAVVISNVKEAPRARKAAAGFEALWVRSLLTAPYASDGRWRFSLSVQHSRPYSWRDDEKELLTELAAWFYPRLERVRAEEALRKSRGELERQAHLYDTTLSTIHDYVYNFDREGRILYANKMLLDLWGMTSEQAIGKTMADLNYPGEVEAKLLAGVREVFETKQTVRNETFYTSPDGSSGYFENVLSPFFASDGSVEFVSGSSRDVSERKRTEEQLRRNHETFFNLVQNAPFGIYVVDSTFRLIQISAGSRKVFSTVDPLIGRDFTEVLRILWPEPFASEAIGHFRDTLQTGDPYQAANTTERRNDIDEIESYDWKIERVILPDGSYGVVCYFYDLTERQQFEVALQEADRRKDDFLAVLGHELRNPLAPIRMGVELMKRSDDPRVLQEARNIIERQSEQLARLLDDLLDVSRISRGAITLQKERVELAEVIELAVESTRLLLEERKHDLKLLLSSSPIYLEADKTRLTQIILNLLTNAAKYTNPGGTITVNAKPQQAEVVISVQDNGIGIPQDMQVKVFDMFTRVERVETYQQQGLGIGLNLVKQLAELHSGSIEVFSAGEGQGSTFTLHLPVSPDVKLRSEAVSNKITPTESVPRLPSGSTVSRRVLVVDDYVPNLKTLARMLRLLGHEVVTAERGEEVLEHLESFNPEVILLDLNLPGMSGYEVAQRIRVNRVHDAKKLVALTGYGQPSDIEKTKQAGFDDHLVKPVVLEKLEALLAKV